MYCIYIEYVYIYVYIIYIHNGILSSHCMNEISLFTAIFANWSKSEEDKYCISITLVCGICKQANTKLIENRTDCWLPEVGGWVGEMGYPFCGLNKFEKWDFADTSIQLLFDGLALQHNGQSACKQISFRNRCQASCVLQWWLLKPTLPLGNRLPTAFPVFKLLTKWTT